MPRGRFVFTVEMSGKNSFKNGAPVCVRKSVLNGGNFFLGWNLSLREKEKIGSLRRVVEKTVVKYWTERKVLFERGKLNFL